MACGVTISVIIMNSEHFPTQIPAAESQTDRVAPEAARRLLASEELVVIGERVPDNEMDIVEVYESYLGVCDVYSPYESRTMADEVRSARKSPNRKVMIGVMTHPLVLRDDTPVPAKVVEGIRRIFPSKEAMAGGFIDDPDVFNTVHYADLYGPDGPRKSGEAPDVCENLELIVRHGGGNLHAIQLDLTWPNASELKKFRDIHPELAIVLQVGKYAFSEVGNQHQEVINRLREYGDAVDYALLDMSMGTGYEMQSSGLLPMLRTIQEELPEMGLAVAGGLGPDTLDSLKPIADEFPGISIDAQGRLKHKDAPKDEFGHLIATHPAELDKSLEYIRQASEILDKE